MHDERAAAEQGLIDTWLRERGDPNELLLQAAHLGYLRALVFALDTAGGSVNAMVTPTTDAICEAAGGAGNDDGIKCIKALLDRGATLSTEPTNNPLPVACAFGHHQTVAWLLQQPEASALMTSVSAYSGLTALGIAVAWSGYSTNDGHDWCMCLLIQHGYKSIEVDFAKDRGMGRAIVDNRRAYERFIAIMAIVKFRKHHQVLLSVDLLRYVARLVWPGPPLKRRK